MEALVRRKFEFSGYRRPFLRGVLKQLIHAGFSMLTEFRVCGLDNVPSRGPLLVVGNHFNFLDPVVFIEALPLPFEFVGGTEMPGAPPIVRWIPAMWGVFRVHRGSVSRDALKNAQSVLSRGGVLGIFPEGGSWAEVLRPARPGAALLAVRTEAQILPVGLEGVTNVFPVHLGRRVRVNVRIGKPFGPFRENIRGRDGRRRLEEIGDMIMNKVAELIPREKRGYYSEDPDVRAAARGTELYPWDDKLEK